MLGRKPRATRAWITLMSPSSTRCVESDSAVAATRPRPRRGTRARRAFRPRCGSRSARRSRRAAGRSRPRGAGARRAARRPRRGRRRRSCRPRPARLEAVAREDRVELGEPCALSSGAGRSRRVAEARERRDLRGRRHVERPPHLRHRRADVPRADRVADAEPGEAVDLRERAQDDAPAGRAGSTPRPRRGSRRRSMYSKYAWSITTSTSSGTRSKNASSSSRVFIVPVGLFGWQT